MDEGLTLTARHRGSMFVFFFFFWKGFLNRHFILEIDKRSYFCSASARSASQVIGPRGNSYHVREQSSILSAFICVDRHWVKLSVGSSLRYSSPWLHLHSTRAK